MLDRLLTFTFSLTPLLVATLLLRFTADPGAQMAALWPKQRTRLLAGTSARICARDRDSANPPRHYHEKLPKSPLPATLDPWQFIANKASFVAYSIAARIPKLLYQMPCYCPCDKEEGHKSLLDCYLVKHGDGCRICQKMVIFAYEQSKMGKSAAEIRTAMEEGDQWQFEFDKYIEAYFAEYKQTAR